MSACLLPCIFTVTTVCFALINQKKLFPSINHPDSSVTRTPQRNQLPQTVKDWRALFAADLMNHNIQPIWQLLFDFFVDKHGITLWSNENCGDHEPQETMDKYPEANGFNFLAPVVKKSLTRWPHFNLHSGSHHAARTTSGIDVIIRVIVSGDEGNDHLKILRYLNGKKPDIVLSSNNILPMISEITFHDITFGVFPKMDTDLSQAFASHIYLNSVEDLFYLILDALEGVKYLHRNRIAHQDLFFQNFMIEWHPESLHRRMARRPRVFIIDFEDAIMFAEDTKPEDMIVPKFPRVLSECGRPVPPEAHDSTSPYCPFRADIWQFGSSLLKFKHECDEVTEIFNNMIHKRPEDRITADEAYEQLGAFLLNQPPAALHRSFPSCG